MRTSVRAALQVVLDSSLEFLARGDALSLCALKSGMRADLLGDAAFWESLTRQSLPSLEALPRGAMRGRRGFLWILRLLRDDTLRVRATPTPDAFRAPPGSPPQDIVCGAA